jgi:hypothetical protein
MNAKEFFETLFEYRGLSAEEACTECGGVGSRAYDGTSTWRGGVGGSAITTDVCDKCWGSGSKSRPWRSWRQVERLFRNEEEAKLKSAKRDEVEPQS